VLEAKLDDEVFWCGQVPVDSDVQIQHTFTEQDGTEHALTLELRGKRPEHTRLGAQGEILEDRLLHISDVSMDDIELGYLMHDKSTYCHDHNSSTEPVQDRFWGTMGCNGTVTLRFTSPAYLWLLEHT
jgi:hypothetical protein